MPEWEDFSWDESLEHDFHDAQEEEEEDPHSPAKMAKTLDVPTLGPSDRTEKLTKWISQLNNKKMKCSRSPKRNFRVEAVLTRTLHNAKYELKSKQVERMARWQRLKKQLLKDVHYGSCGLYHAIEAEQENDFVREENESQIDWFKELDLDDLNDFLRQISEVKTHIDR